MERSLKALVLGDVVGGSGVRALCSELPGLITRIEADLVIANAENAADGFGLTAEIAEALFAAGVSMITSGNHIWQRREILDHMKSERRILRPANYPEDPPGDGWGVVRCGSVAVGVLNLQGRVRLSNVDCPFRTARRLLREIQSISPIILVDFHAEDCEEKEAMGQFLDGEVSLVVGTHTHVQTADERILEGGTGYITDIGMTGPFEGVIGFETDLAVTRMINQMPIKMQVAESAAAIRGVAVEIDVETGHAVSIERVDCVPGS